MIANKRYVSRHKATEEDDDQGIAGKEICRRKWKWRTSCTGTAGGRWRRQCKRELDKDKWSMA